MEHDYTKLAEVLGMEVESKTGDSTLLIRHRASGAVIALNEPEVMLVLNFFNDIRSATNDSLEERVHKLEEAVFERSTPNQSTVKTGDNLPGLEELKVRAAAIGTSIWEGDVYYTYSRPRFIVSGTPYVFYFTVDNAFEPRRRHHSGPRYEFRIADEYPILVKWIEHDEKIFAELNEKYGIKSN